MNAVSTLAGAASLANMLAPPQAPNKRYSVTDQMMGGSYNVDAPTPEEATEYVRRMTAFKRVAPELGWLMGALLATLAWLFASKST